jgi:hypothetical protein
VELQNYRSVGVSLERDDFLRIVIPLYLFVEHDLFVKPVPTFPDHALAGAQCVQGMGRKDADAREEQERNNDIHDATCFVWRHTRRGNVSGVFRPAPKMVSWGTGAATFVELKGNFGVAYIQLHNATTRHRA